MADIGTTSNDAVHQPIRWLHLSDLHVGKNDESQRIALRSLIEAIHAAADGKSFDLVFLTGDLVYSGLGEQYDELENVLIGPLRKSDLFRGARFFAVPGNHDLDCDVGLPIVWRDIGKSRQEKFFHANDQGRQVRESRAKGFAEYASYIRKANIESVDPLTQAGSLSRLEVRGRTLAIATVATAFFSDKEISDHRKSPAPTHVVRAFSQEILAGEQLVVLGHHPLDWFTSDSEQQLYALLVERNAIYLHGHLHQVIPRFGARGLVSLGFGAAYQAPSDVANFPYRNSFAICELHDSLHVAIVSWDAQFGQWRPDSNLTGDFVERSEVLPQGYQLDIPTTKLSQRQSRSYAAIGAAIRHEVAFERTIWLAKNQPKRWVEALSTIGQLRKPDEIYGLPTSALATGHTEFRVKDETGQYLVHAVSAHGDILTYEQLQAINTELDRQDYDACIVATLGTLSTEAKTLASQLSSRKSIFVIERDEIVRRTIRNLPPGLDRALTQADPKVTGGCLVFRESGLALLLAERGANGWFQVLENEGNIAIESAEVVQAVRSESPLLRTAKYGQTTARPALVLSPPVAVFDRADYLKRSADYFDDVKYAPLAALGFQFGKASLSEIYVDASADVGGSAKQSQNLSRAISELVDSLDLSPAQRDQLESQLKSRYGLNTSSEVGAARGLYQRFNNIVVLGDPGSGKTCFLQHEILAYCDSSPEDASWYSHHLPIYVSLAEAARLLDKDHDLLDICSTVSSRRGIDLPRSEVERAISEGRAAFFFDGLDEVGYLDTRIELVNQVGQLVKAYARSGNRFVLASRPAAIQPVDIPDAFTYLQLKGLTESEVRVLAGRVLTVRVHDTSTRELTPDDKGLIDRLIEDTRSSPGIARIARNPLLLTLLVLIYASTGAVSARRHLIYTQAIKTLVSVRGRQSKEQQISEADLRSRLGALALAIFDRKTADIPKRSEVVQLLAPLVPSENDARRSSADSADAFVQEVAESTGLLTIHSRGGEKSDDLVSFMHYSFLEYYAAAGLMLNDLKSDLARLSTNPRWRDVTTLLFGILSEQTDVTPHLEQIVADVVPADSISKYRLLLALDCAAECDVPPEAAQDVLSRDVLTAISRGPGRYSSKLRSEIAQRLGYFLQGAGPRLVNAICQGLESKDSITVAATCDLIARLGEGVQLPRRVVGAFGAAVAHESAVTRSACLFAMEKHLELRGPDLVKLLRQSFRGSLIEKDAALKLAASAPQYLDSLVTEVRELVSDPNPLIALEAAQCLLATLLKGNQWSGGAALLERILAKISDGRLESALSLPGITLEPAVIQTLIASPDPAESELAIRSMALVKDNNEFVYQTLIQVLRSSSNSRIRTACLEAFRVCPGAISLITLADTDAICGYARSEERNVRKAALGLLGDMPDDEQVVQTLRSRLDHASGDPDQADEVLEASKALAKHVRRNRRLQADVLEAVLIQLPANASAGFGDKNRQEHLYAMLTVCESIGGITSNSASSRLIGLAEDFRTPMQIRRQVMRVYGQVVEPDVASINKLIDLVSRDQGRMSESVYSAVAAFIFQAHKKVEYVRRIHHRLGELQTTLCDAWNREVGKGPDNIDPPGLREIRDAIVGISELVARYDEFSGRATVA